MSVVIQRYPCPNGGTTLKGVFGMLVAIRDMLSDERAELLDYNPNLDLPRVVEFGSFEDFVHNVTLDNHTGTAKLLREARQQQEGLIREFGHMWTHAAVIRLRAHVYINLIRILRGAFADPSGRLRDLEEKLKHGDMTQSAFASLKQLFPGGTLGLFGPFPFGPPPHPGQDDMDDDEDPAEDWKG